MDGGELDDPENLIKPTQQSLDVIVSDVRSVRVCRWQREGDYLRPSAVLTIDQGPRVRELLDLLAIVESDDFFHCMCVGSLIVELVAREGVVATLTVHHGLSIRWDGAWGSDAMLRNGWSLARWLADEGVTSLLEEMEEAEREAARHSKLLTAWCEAMPACVRTLYEPATEWQEDEPIEPMIASLQSEYRTDQQLALSLCEWHGTLGSEWGWYYAFETLVERLLNHLGADRVVRALQDAALNRRQAEGAARYLVSSARLGDLSLGATEVLRACRAALDDPNKAETIRRLVGD